MAKKKYHVLPSKHFFNIVVLSASALGLMLAVMVLQKPTNTRSNASGCLKNPRIQFLRSDENKIGANTTYHLKLYNYCPRDRVFIIDVVELPTKPYKYDNWLYTFPKTNRNFSPLTINVENDRPAYFNLYVNRPFPVDPNNKDKRILIPEDTYKYVVVKAWLKNNQKIYDKIYLNYIVDNP